MKSHSCKKTRGEGVPSGTTLNPEPPEPSPQLQEQDDEAALCRHVDAQGRRCRMLVTSIDSGFCAYHAQRLLHGRHGSEIAAAELLACGAEFSDAAAVNRFLGNLVRQVTLKRIPRRDAITLAYICQLLLNSLGAINREEALRLEASRGQALFDPKCPPRIIWDIPGPPYEPPDPLDNFAAGTGGSGPSGRS